MSPRSGSRTTRSRTPTGATSDKPHHLISWATSTPDSPVPPWYEEDTGFRVPKVEH